MNKEHKLINNTQKQVNNICCQTGENTKYYMIKLGTNTVLSHIGLDSSYMSKRTESVCRSLPFSYRAHQYMRKNLFKSVFYSVGHY